MNRLHNKCTCFQLLQLAIWYIHTKVLVPKARLIRFPFKCYGKKYIDFGHNLTTGRNCRIEAYSLDSSKEKRIIFGDNVQINDNVHIVGMKEVRIENDVLLASHIFISDNSHGCYKGISEDSSPFTIPMEREYYVSPVVIGEKTWIGEGVVIMPGVNIGKGVVIGSNSVVTKDIPSYSIAVGVPAKVIKQYDFITKKWIKYNEHCR